MSNTQFLLEAYKTLLVDYRKMIDKYKDQGASLYNKLQKDLLEKLKEIPTYNVDTLTRFISLTLILFPILEEWFIEELFQLANIDSKEVLNNPKVKNALKDFPNLYLKYYMIGS
jgi:hypothetical protein